ncbi:trimeric intracellular cation channel family protein [Pseudooceanicola sp. 200-1SW]|uniref:trimeric intracellular cation channel family protein n=1 Tax=Pseudooceanicola sp. 200-1SW TaxID=3425949 RepID=UPI003D7F4803
MIDHPLLFAADALATLVFATTGALVASRKEMDIFGFMWLAAATGVGGGTLRDLLLGVPVFWVANPLPLALCLGVAVLLHFTASLVQSRMALILWMDCFGLGFAVIAGTLKAMDHGVAGLVAVVMGVFSGSVGGIIRDTLGQEPSVILKREIYVTAAALGATATVLLVSGGQERLVAAVAGFALVCALRGAALMRNLTLPAFRPRKGRDYS